MPAPTNKTDDPCQECRDRHLKCDDNYPKCRQCERLGERCRRGKGKLKFRVGSSAKYDAAFAKDQTWLDQTRNAKFQFVDQGPELENYYSQDDFLINGNRSNSQEPRREDVYGDFKRIDSPVEIELSPTIRSAPPSDAPAFLSPPDTIHENLPPQLPLKRRRTTDDTDGVYLLSDHRPPHSAYDPIRSQYRIYEGPKSPNSANLYGFTYMPDQQQVSRVVEAEYRRLADDAAAAIPPDSLLSPAMWEKYFYWPNQFTTTQCACLMRYYIEKLAPWFDVGDPARHFTLAVPQYARRCPPLLNAIFTLAARHLASLAQFRTSDGVVRYQDISLPALTEATAVRYHQACIAYLIKLSSDRKYVRDERMLASAVILRYYEDIDPSLTEEDNQTLIHTFKLFVDAQANPCAQTMDHIQNNEYLRPGSAVGTFDCVVYLKGFQHASFRVALRQEITIALRRRRAIRLPFETWSVLQRFDEAEDFVWTDRHLYHCAEVLQYCFGGGYGNGQIAIERWNELREFEKHWEDLKPLSFMPLQYQLPDRSKGECLPQIWYMADVQVLGMMFLDLARILLTANNPNIPRIGPRVTAAQRSTAEEEVRDIVIRLCGTAVSLGGLAGANASSQPAMVLAYVAITGYGDYFTDLVERRALLDILDRLKNDHGWPTAKVAMELKGHWGWV